MPVKNDLTILEKTYSFFLKKKVVGKHELETFSNDLLNRDLNYLYRNFIYKLIRQGKVTRIRRGLYCANDIYRDKMELHNKHLIGSKIRNDYYLGYHTALEVLGCAQSIHNRCYISVGREHRFDRFSFENITYQAVVVKDVRHEVIVRIADDHPVDVSSPSRTFVECIHRPDLCIGYEEVYKSLESLGGVDIDRIISVLELYENDLHVRSVGFFLEYLSERSPYYSHIEEKDLRKIRERIGKSRKYLIRGQRGDYDARWRLYIPEGFKELLPGVR